MTSNESGLESARPFSISATTSSGLFLIFFIPHLLSLFFYAFKCSFKHDHDNKRPWIPVAPAPFAQIGRSSLSCSHVDSLIRACFCCSGGCFNGGNPICA